MRTKTCVLQPTYRALRNAQCGNSGAHNGKHATHTTIEYQKPHQKGIANASQTQPNQHLKVKFKSKRIA